MVQSARLDKDEDDSLGISLIHTPPYAYANARRSTGILCSSSSGVVDHPILSAIYCYLTACRRHAVRSHVQQKVVIRDLNRFFHIFSSAQLQ